MVSNDAREAGRRVVKEKIRDRGNGVREGEGGAMEKEREVVRGKRGEERKGCERDRKE